MKAFAAFLQKFRVGDYSPFGTLNIILSVVGVVPMFFVLYVTFSMGYGMTEWDSSVWIAFAVFAVATVILLFRNRKLKSIPKMIIYTIISLAVGIIFALLLLVAFYKSQGGLFDNAGTQANMGYYESVNSSYAGSSQKSYTENQEKAANYAGYSSAQEADKAGKLAQAEGTYESSAEKMLNM